MFIAASDTRSVAQLVAEAKQSVDGLSPAQFESEIAAGGVLVVDLREADERVQSGAIPGSLHAPRGMLEFYADPASPYHRPEFAPSRRTLLYCASGGRSALAALALAGLGYGDVAHLDGGVKGWISTGRKLVEA